MWAFAKTLLLFTRQLRRIANSLEALHKLYALDLESRDIVPIVKQPEDYKPSKSEMAHINYASSWLDDD